MATVHIERVISPIRQLVNAGQNGFLGRVGQIALGVFLT